VSPRAFRFRARYRGLALSALGIGGTLGAVSVAVLGAALLPLATGVAGVALGAGYLLSPTWRLEVVVDDEALEVRGPNGSKFKLTWGEVVRVVASDENKTCFVDGGVPEKSLIVPGDGMPAPYDIENKAELYATILSHVPAEKVRPVNEVVG
jgi:hypothetical protein